MLTLGTIEVAESCKQIYKCKICDYTTSRKSSYEKHLSTDKHIKTTMTTTCSHMCSCGKVYSNRQNLYRHKKVCNVPNNSTAKVAEVANSLPKVSHVYECECGRTYRHASSLSKHKRTCLHVVEAENENQSVDNTKVLEVLETVNDKLDKTEESNRVLREELKTIKTDMMTAVAEPKVINNYTNINIFLNDKCGDAMAIQDFAKELIICLEDVNYALENGKVSGIENIIRKKFDELGVYKRPLHCTDVKRGTLYVKGEEGWEKEKGEMNKMIRDVECIQTTGIKVWGDANPEYSQGNHKLMEKWLRIVQCLTNTIDSAGIRKIEKRCHEMSKISQDELA